MINMLASYNNISYIFDVSQMNSLTGLPIMKNDIKDFFRPLRQPMDKDPLLLFLIILMGTFIILISCVCESLPVILLLSLSVFIVTVLLYCFIKNNKRQSWKHSGINHGYHNIYHVQIFVTLDIKTLWAFYWRFSKRPTIDRNDTGVGRCLIAFSV